MILNQASGLGASAAAASGLGASGVAASVFSSSGLGASDVGVGVDLISGVGVGAAAAVAAGAGDGEITTGELMMTLLETAPQQVGMGLQQAGATTTLATVEQQGRAAR